MEKAAARPRAEKPKLVPLKDDIDACLNVLSREQAGLLRANSQLGERATAALQPLSRSEKAEYAHKVGEGRLAPLTHEAMEENERRIDDLDDLKKELESGMKAIAAGRLPDASFLKALREAWHIDRQQANGDLMMLQSLRRKHAEGVPLNEKEYEAVNRLPTQLALAEERLKRLRDRLHTFQGVRHQEEVELGFTSEGELTHRQRLEEKTGDLKIKTRNSPGQDRGLERDHRESEPTARGRKAA